MSRVLFINLPSRETVYLNTNVKVGTPGYANLTLATLAAHLRKEHTVAAYDLDLPGNSLEDLLRNLAEFKPDVVAASVKTPEYFAAREVMKSIKERFPGITTVGGGVHLTAMPEESMRECNFDILVVGEGDTALVEILTATSLDEVPGILCRRGKEGDVIRTRDRELMPDIDWLPFPAWDLFEIGRYRSSRLSARRNPVGLIETSRGCAYQCNFCNKLTFGSRFRAKSTSHVLAEMEYLLKCGFREIHIIDDSFTQDIARAKEICEGILRKGLRFPWSLFNGVRVNMVDSEFLRLARRAGCWQIGFGIESGDQKVLDSVSKGVRVEQNEEAVHLTSEAGIDSFGFFIFGLSGETEESMQRTIDFAKRLPLGIAKFDICIPYPGTRYYEDLLAQGRIRSTNWSRYVCHGSDEPLFDHPNLDWETISKYYKRAYRDFYLRPSYIGRRFVRSLKQGDLLHDAKSFLQTRWS